MKRWIYGLVVLALIGSGVTAAQDAVVDTAALDYITSAFEKTLAAESLHIEAQSQTEIAGLPQGFSMGQQGTENFDIVRSGDAWNASGTRTMSMSLPNNEINITIDSIVMDGKTYLRMDGVPEQTAQDVPSGWFDAAQLAESSQTPFVGNVEDLASMILGSLALPINADSVTALNELAPDTINGQGVRVFQLTLDPAAVIDSDAGGLLSAGFGGGFGGGPGGGAPLGQAPADAPDVQPLNPEDAQITFAVYVGDDDQLIHRIYSVIALASADDTQPSLTITTVTDYSKFNEPVEITAPEITP